jgi:hypothetical protein
MNAKLLIFLLAVVLVAGLLLWSGNENVIEGTTDKAPVDGERELPSGHPTMSLPLPTISRANLAVQNTDGTDLGEIWLVPNEPAALPNTPYQLKLTEFYTHWNWDKRPVNLSYSERNPAVRVGVLHGDSLLYYQWAFRDMRFFRRGSMGGHPGTETDQLAFTLLSYEDLSLPEQHSVKE